MKTLFKWLGLYDQDGRKAWAFLSMLLGCGIMTGFAAIALHMVRADLTFVFWLGMAAHAQVFMALAGFTAFFVKREIQVGRDGAKVKDLNIEEVKGDVNVQHNDQGEKK